MKNYFRSRGAAPKSTIGSNDRAIAESSSSRALDWRKRLDKRNAIVTVLAFAVLGTGLLILSGALTGNFQYSADPNSVVVQYILPHRDSAINTQSLQAADTAQPFTLYGNGLLVCGHSNPTPFNVTTANQTNPDLPSLATATTLNADDVQNLLQQISDTGFFQLNQEYFNHPVSEEQDIIRLSLLSGDHYVMYYNDVSAPAAYTNTLSILSSYCARATDPYQASTVRLKVLKDANPKSHQVVTSQSLAADVAPAISASLDAADVAKANQANPQAQASQVAVPGEADQDVTGAAAQSLITQFAKQPHKFIQRNGSTYEVSVEPQLPTIKNQLNVDYKAIRKSKSLGAKINSRLFPPAYADAGTPIRIVVLLASDGGGTATQGEAQTLGQAIHDWYCGQVNACYNYAGASVMRGSQTESYYMTCHGGDPCANNPLSAVLYNVSEQDNGTIYDTANYDTLLVTGWPTGEISRGSCGYGYIGLGLAVVDYYEPTINNTPAGASYCQPGHDGAHELGHTFGLNHTGDGTLMDGPPYTNLASNCDIDDAREATCRLDANQATWLAANSSYFSTSTTQAPPPPTSPTWQAGWSSGYGSLADYNTNDGSCIDLPKDSTTEGTNLQQWGCWSTDGQQWQFVASNNRGYFEIVNKHSHQCMEVAGASKANGAKIQQWGCWGGGQQLWKIAPSYARGYYRIVNYHSNLCIDVANKASTSNGTPLQQWGCWNTKGQQWSGAALNNAASYAQVQPSGPQAPEPQALQQPWSSGYSSLADQLTASRSCIDIPYGTPANGTLLQQWGCWATSEQQWKFVDTGAPGLYEIVDQATGSCLDLPNGSATQGTKLQEWGCWNGPMQLWRIVRSNVSGYYELVNNASGQCIDVTGGSTSNGTPLQEWGCWNAPQQLWTGGALTAAAAQAGIPSSGPPPPQSMATNELYNGQILPANYYLVSSQGYRLVVQTDGNLVEYGPGGNALWASNTVGSGTNNYLIMQGDGNLVMYTAANQPVWSSTTYGFGSSTFFALQDDSNMVIYKTNGIPIWDRYDGILTWYSGFSSIANLNTGGRSCIDIPNANPANGTPLQQWGCWGASQQQWRLMSINKQGYHGLFEIISQATGGCIDLPNGASAQGTRLQEYGCWEGPNQLWRLVPSSTAGYYELVNNQSGQCLDATASAANGASIQQWGCWFGPQQLWTGGALSAAAGY